MIKKICFSLSILSLATSIATAAYVICCKKKAENKVDARGNNKA
jgi:hypothetical protein